MIDPRSPSEGSRAEFARLIEIHGAERRRWPAARQALFDAHADEPAHADLLGKAAALDGALADAGAVVADESLKSRLLATFAPARAPQRGVGFTKKWFRLAPAGAFAALSAAGFFVGSATAQVEDEAIYYAEAAISSPLEGGASLWSEEQ